MGKLKIVFRNFKTNKIRTSIYFLLIVIIVGAQVLSYTSYQQFNEKYSDLKYDLRSYISIGGWRPETTEVDYKKNPYLYNSKVSPTLITEEEYEKYKKSDLIKNSSYILDAYAVATAKGTRRDYEGLTIEESFMYEWEDRNYEDANPDSHPTRHISFYSLGSMETLYGDNYEYQLLEGVDTLSDGEILMGEEEAHLLKVKVGDTIPIHQTIYSNGSISDESDYGFEAMKEYYIDYSLKVVGIYRLDYIEGLDAAESSGSNYGAWATNFTTANTIIEYDELVKKVKNNKDFKNFTANESQANFRIEFYLKNPNDKSKLEDELNEKGLNHRYTLFTGYEDASNDLVPIMSVMSQLQIACIVITIIAILAFVVMMIYENKKREKESSVLYLLGYSKKDIWLIMFIEKMVLLLAAGVIAIIATNLVMRDLLYHMSIASCEHYYIDVMGYIITDDMGTDSLLYSGLSILPWDSADAFVNLKVGLQPLHFIILIAICGLQALLASGWILWKKVSDFDFLGRK